MTGDDGALAAMPSSAVWIQAGTVGVEGIASWRRWPEGRAWGSSTRRSSAPGPRREGQLVVLAAGPEQLRDRVQPVFDAIGQRTMWVGDVGAASRLKLVANSWVLAVTTAVAEAMALAQAARARSRAVPRGDLRRRARPAVRAAEGRDDHEVWSSRPRSRWSGAAKDAGLIVSAAEAGPASTSRSLPPSIERWRPPATPVTGTRTWPPSGTPRARRSARRRPGRSGPRRRSR